MAEKHDTGAPDLKVVEGGKIEHRGGDTTGGKLTAYQLKFVQNILSGMNQTDAYRGAGYDTSRSSDKTVHELASRLFANDKISSRIKAGQARQENAALLSGLATRQHIQRTLYGLTTDGENDAAKLKACDLLGRLTDVAAFTERVEQVTDNRTPEELTKELETRLREAFGD